MANRREKLADALAVVLSDEGSAAAIARCIAEGWRLKELARGPLAPLWTVDLAGPSPASRLAVTDPREAWEALAARGVIPASWVEDPRRAFHDGEERSLRTFRSGGVRFDHVDRTAILAPHPPTVAACVALASDPEGVTTAEAIAREVTGVERVVWYVMPSWVVAEHVERVGPRHRTAAVTRATGYVVRWWDHSHVALLCQEL